MKDLKKYLNQLARAQTLIATIVVMLVLGLTAYEVNLVLNTGLSAPTEATAAPRIDIKSLQAISSEQSSASAKPNPTAIGKPDPFSP